MVVLDDTHQGLGEVSIYSQNEVRLYLTMTVPHATMRAGNHIEGRSFFRSRLDGNSKAAYVKKKADTTVVRKSKVLRGNRRAETHNRY
jgi:hypothetical protein